MSLLSSPSKILERVVLCQLQNFISQSDPPILPPEQFAYRHGYSCEDLLSKNINDWHVALDAGKVVGVIMLDSSKAFDCVNHELLLLELQSCGIGGAALVWFASYLHGRISRVLTSHAPPGEEFEASHRAPSSDHSYFHYMSEHYPQCYAIACCLNMRMISHYMSLTEIQSLSLMPLKRMWLVYSRI